MLYLIIERFRGGDAVPWSDLVDFEVIPVRTWAETSAAIAPRL